MVDGLMEGADLIFLITFGFAMMYVLEKTKSIDALMAKMIKNSRNNPKYSTIIICISMLALAALATTGTITEEDVLIFAPVFAAMGIAIGYDAILGFGFTLVAVASGWCAGIINPYTVGVAQTIADIKMFSNMGWRVIAFIVFLTIGISYVLIYGKRIKKDPLKSIVSDCDFTHLEINDERMKTPFTLTRKLSLLVLVIGVCTMGYALAFTDWYLREITALYIVMIIVIGVINKWRPNIIAKYTCEGLAVGIYPASVVGIARGIAIIIQNGNILDTIAHAAIGVLDGIPIFISAFGMLIFQTLFNFIVPSGSGQAAITMPLMTPIADGIGMSREIAVMIFQFGDGFSNILWPTAGACVICCALTGVPFSRWYKWFVPLFLLVMLAAYLIILCAILFGV